MAPKKAVKLTPDTQKSHKLEKPISKPKKKKNYQSFSIYAYKLLRSVKPEIGISSKAMLIITNFIDDTLAKLVTQAATFVKKEKKRTMTSTDIRAAANLILPGELAKHARIEGMKALKKFHDNQKDEKA